MNARNEGMDNHSTARRKVAAKIEPLSRDYAGAIVVVGMVGRLIVSAVGSVVVLLIIAWLIGGCGATQPSAAPEGNEATPAGTAAPTATPVATAPPESTAASKATSPPAPTATSAPTGAAPTPNAGGDADEATTGGPDEGAANQDDLEKTSAGPDNSITVAASDTFAISGEDYAGAVQPILEHKCASCHSAGGPGAESLELSTAGDAAAAADDIADAVGAGYMPPWPASSLSVPFRYDRSLTDEQVEILVNWGKSGGELDVPADTPIEVAVQPLELDNPDSEYRIEPYQSESTVTDDYRCFVIAPGEAEQRWITGFDMVPDRTENVHHAIVYRVDASERDQAAGMDGADGQPGWTCYGQTGLGRSALLLGWAPGQDAFVADPGTAFPVKPESFLVLQIHYHFDDARPVDQSSLKVDWGDPDGDYRPFDVAAYVGPVEIPCADGEDGPLCERDAAMAAAMDRYGAEGVRNEFINFACGVQPEDFAAMTTGEVTSTCTLPAYGFGEIVSILGHEHELGSSFRLTLNQGDEQTVLVDIPDWDFDWQYQYRPVDQIVIAPGDTITIDCGWDRNRRSQDAEPSYVLWADGTSDEMCFATIVTVPSE